MSDRESVLKAVNQVKPALASQSYVPALTHVAFDGEYATTYNDITAIRVRCKTEFSRCLPGDLLQKALNNLTAPEVAFQEAEGSIIVAAGRSKIKLASLPINDFPFAFPDDSRAAEIGLKKAVLAGIERCLISVGQDPSHPAQMGVTLESVGGEALLYSTDNYTISRYIVETKVKLPGDTPVILPTFFCEQLLALAKTFPDSKCALYIRPGSVVAQFEEDALLFTKMVVDLEPLDFVRILKRHASEDELSSGCDLPDGYEAAFQRALLVLGSGSEKVTRVSVTEGSMKLNTVSPYGEVTDRLKFSGKEDLDIHIDPTLVLRASKVCDRILIKDNITVLSTKDGTFTHMIAHSVR